MLETINPKILSYPKVGQQKVHSTFCLLHDGYKFIIIQKIWNLLPVYSTISSNLKALFMGWNSKGIWFTDTFQKKKLHTFINLKILKSTKH